jgi:hypothetical protein
MLFSSTFWSFFDDMTSFWCCCRRNILLIKTKVILTWFSLLTMCKIDAETWLRCLVTRCNSIRSYLVGRKYWLRKPKTTNVNLRKFLRRLILASINHYILHTHKWITRLLFSLFWRRSLIIELNRVIFSCRNTSVTTLLPISSTLLLYIVIFLI